MNACFLQIFSSVTGLLAAGFWLWSAIARVPDLIETKLGGKGSITDIMQKQSLLNAIAASLTAAAIVAQMLGQLYGN